MKERFIRSLSKAMWDTDLIATRVWLSLAEFFWALMLLIPADGLFSRPTYKHMATVMSQDQWGIIMLVSAVTQIVIVLQDDYRSRFAQYFAFYNASLWCYVGIWSPLASVSPPPAAMGAEMAAACAAVFIAIRPSILRVGYMRGYRNAGLC
jgi:hypothetical protein